MIDETIRPIINKKARLDIPFMELVKGLLPISAMFNEFNITHLSLNSNTIGAGGLFFAIKGTRLDGRDFIEQAIKNRAHLILVQSDDPNIHGQTKVKQGCLLVYFYELPKYISKIAARFYGEPSKQLKVVGVTGTNGKTTVTHLIAQWLELLNEKSAILGTMGNGFIADLKESDHTTSDAIELQRELEALRNEKARVVAIEVSSHGLDQYRVKDLTFAAIVFTNLTQDHLDYHHNMKEYAEVKKRLFTEHTYRSSVINIDDATGAQWIKQFPQAVAITIQDKPLDVLREHEGYAVWLTDITYHSKGIAIDFESSWGGGHMNVPLIGHFNASNLLVALATLLNLGYDINELIAVSEHLHPVKGRMELLHQRRYPLVVIDYAHTPDALMNVLTSLRRHCKGKLWCVWGCGGDRDRTKRPIMAKMVEKYADHFVITDDNPRTEDPLMIVSDCLSGLQYPHQATVIHDRKEAIAFAMSQANEDDIILIAGKGHEPYQIIGKEKFKFSDHDCVLDLFEQQRDK